MQDQGSDSSVDAVGLDKYVGKGRMGKGMEKEHLCRRKVLKMKASLRMGSIRYD